MLIKETWVLAVLFMIAVEIVCLASIIVLNMKLLNHVRKLYPLEFEWFVANNHINYGLSFFLFNRLPAHSHILDDTLVKHFRKSIICSAVLFVFIFFLLFPMLYFKRL